MKNQNELKQVWEDNLKLFPNSHLNYPDENLVRMFSGKYINIQKPPAKLMDHGFGHGNNLNHFLKLGYDCSGCEISQTLIDMAKETGLDLRAITDDTIPFDDESFDIVVSWNVLHYAYNARLKTKMVQELRRILKPGGSLILSTVAPGSSMMDRVTPLGENSFLINDNLDDNRKGIRLYIHKTDQEIRQTFKDFSKVEIGRATFNPCNAMKRNDAWIIHAQVA